MKTLLQFNHRGEQIFAFALTRSSFQNHGSGSPSKVNTSEAISSGETILIRQENKKRDGDVLSVVGMWKCENKQRKVSTRQVSSRLSETRLCQEMAASRKNCVGKAASETVKNGKSMWVWCLERPQQKCYFTNRPFPVESAKIGWLQKKKKKAQWMIL